MIRRWLKPNAAGWVLLVLLLGVQPILIVQISGSVAIGSATTLPVLSTMETTTSFGLPPLVEIKDTYQEDPAQSARQVDVRWDRIACVLLVSYLIAMVMGRLVSAGAEGVAVRRGWRHPAVVLAIVITTIVTSALVLAIVLSSYPGARTIDVNVTQSSAIYIEIPEWHINFIGFTLLGLFLVMPIMILVMIVRRWRERRRATQRGFPVEFPAP